MKIDHIFFQKKKIYKHYFLTLTAISLIFGYAQVLWRHANNLKNLMDSFIYCQLKITVKSSKITDKNSYNFLKNHEKNRSRSQSQKQIPQNFS